MEWTQIIRREAPSITAESPLLPIVGPSSVLTANGLRHLRQRKLLLPPFHGQAIERYVRMISEVTDREIDRWPVGRPLALAPRMPAITLDVIETTANQLAWTWERLVRNPIAYERLRSAVRSDSAADEHIDATITEAMRSRPVIPAIGRRVLVPWRLGDYAVPADTPIVLSILLLHHRPDLYSDPFAFRPERWLERKQQDDPGDAQSGDAGRRAGVKQQDDPGSFTPTWGSTKTISRPTSRRR